MRFLLIVSIALAVAGCVSNPPMYQWGGYENSLYAAYKEPNKTEELRVSLETLIAAQEQGKQKVAPGLYAELGTLYLQAGAMDKAIPMYEKERATWPESKGLMDAMIANLERRKSAQQEASK